MIKKIKDYFNKNKQEKLKKEIRNKRAEYDKLKIKFDDGIINNSELNKYYKLKEELNKMAKKFIMKDGKLVLNSEDDNNQEPKEEPKVQEPKVQESKEEEQVQETKQEEPKEQPQEQVQKPMVEKPQNDEQLYARMKQEEQLKEEQARQEYLRTQQLQQAQMQERMRIQQAQQPQREQAQAQQPQQQEPQLLTLSVFVQDMPVLTTVIYANVADKVISDIREARKHNEEFRLGAYFIMANKIIGYKFDEYDPKELEQRGGN